MNHLIRKCILAGLCSGAAHLALADVTVNFVNTERDMDVPRQTVQPVETAARWQP